MKFPYITIITDDAGKYKSVTVAYSFFSGSRGDKLKVFDSGDICKDYEDCQIFCIREFVKKFPDLPIMSSSSVDHWCMDNEEYGWDTKAIEGYQVEVIVKS